MSEDDRDHRILGQKLDLFHFRDEAPGMVFWHPRGLAMVRELERAAREQARAQGYLEVRTPQVLRRAAWDASGHFAHFREHMFRIEDQSVEAALKPVSCPGHLYVASRRALSYRELPLRYAELGVVHRDEASGNLHGLLRVRQFTQDDGHVLAAWEDIPAEVRAFCAGIRPFYRAFGFDDIALALSTRPNDRAGDDASWDAAESALRDALVGLGESFVENPGQGAFYGPKIEVSLRDRHGRSWQCGTIQLDLVMPARFDVRYVDASGLRRVPAMLHRALFGSLERFLGIVLEHHGARLPAWLAPVQAVVLPVTGEAAAHAEALARELERNDVRALVLAHDSLARRIVEAHALAAPYVLVVGKNEVRDGTISMRRPGKSDETLPRGEALSVVTNGVARPSFG